MMQAIVIEQYGGPEQLKIAELPIPEPSATQVLVRVRAFGLNRAETYMRSGRWADGSRVTGIECVGEVAYDPRGQLRVGQRVCALMGGMGRSIQGSYAQYVAVPASNVVAIESALPWSELAALPESYATAWSCLHENLALAAGQRLLIRGGSSALGQAAINIARERGACVFASTRAEARFAALRGLGAEPVQEQRELARSLCERAGAFDAVLDLIGSSTLFDSLRATRRGGRVCVAGFLGGHESLAAFDPVFQLPSGVQLSAFASVHLGSAEFPLAAIPLQEIAHKAELGTYQAHPAHVFRFEQIVEAHRLLESNQAGGKLVVTLQD